ncbi:MAG: nucleoside triphosphate pyrophosphohydrolase family protein [Henriciella sp.]
MLIKQYAAFVSRTNQFANHSMTDAREIAIYGLASEIGSVVSAIKKENLNEGGALCSPIAKMELREELGDAIWYAFALARIVEEEDGNNILLNDVEKLREEIGRNDARGARIRKVLTQPEVDAFFAEAASFENNKNRTLSDYQRLAYRTARTQGDTLLTVCAAVLTQLGAQLMRVLLPEIEHELNTQLKDRKISSLLRQIAWHLCAIASLYDLEMDDVAAANVEKAGARQRRDDRRTPFHDEKFPAHEQLPRYFEIEFRPVSNDVTQMYWNGEELGDPLKDQYSISDGYRFHDVMHLANAACLGWSPVLRELMDIKRRSCPATKDEQDGGRSAVVEELVLKYIHWEGSRRANLLHEHLPPDQRPVFQPNEGIPFSVVKTARDYTIGHEVYANKYWEWEEAIAEGYRVFQQLRDHKQGRVIVDLNNRCLKFEPLN